MNFVNPMIAWVGLAAVALPIIIHIIMRRKRKPISWGAMRFLEEALRRQRKRTRLEQLLLLATRCLIVALIALALGRPMFGDAGIGADDAPRTLYIVIDDSLTSDLRTDGRSALDRTIAQAQEAIDGLSAARGDSVAIVTSARPAQTLILPATSDLTAAKAALTDLKPKDSRADFAGALDLIAQERGTRTERYEVAVFSEFRAGSIDAAASAPRANVFRHAKFSRSASATEPVRNVRLKSLRVVQPPIFRGDERISIPVRVSAIRHDAGASTGIERMAIRISLTTPGKLGDSLSGTDAELVWPEGQEESSSTIFVQVDPQALKDAGELIVTATLTEDPLARDNVFRVSTRAWKRLETLIVAPGADVSDDPARFTPAQWLSLSLAPEAEESDRRRLESDIRVTVIDPARSSQPAALAKARAILIPSPERIDAAGWTQITSAARAGVFVLITPPAAFAPQTWGDELARAGWTLGVSGEPRQHDPALRLSVIPAAAEPDGPLGLLGSELEDLLKPVSVFRSVAVAGSSDSYDSILSLSDGSPFLILARPQDGGSGTIAVLAAAPDPEWTDLPTKPLMLPLMQELIRQGVAKVGQGVNGIAGERPRFPTGAVELREVGGIRAYSSSEDSPAIRESGIFVARDSSGSPIETTIFNPSFEAGDTSTLASERVSEWFRSTGAESVNETAEQRVSRADDAPRDAGWSLMLLTATLLLAAIEAFLARAFSHAKMEAVK